MTESFVASFKTELTVLFFSTVNFFYGWTKAVKNSLYRTHRFRSFWEEREEGEREAGSSKFLTLPDIAGLHLVVMQLHHCFRLKNKEEIV